MDIANHSAKPTSILKLQTQSLHRSIDRHPLMKRLVASDLKKEEYARILATLYRWHELLQSVLDSLDLQQEFYALDKLLMLEQDLLQLSSDPVDFQLAALKPADEAYALGVLYVVEGSSLGAQFIAPRVEKSLRSHQLTHYYRMYGDAVAANWSTTQSELNNRLDNKMKVQRAVLGARDAFTLLLAMLNAQISSVKNGVKEASIL